MQKSPDQAAVAVMVLLCACWGLNQVAIKIAAAGISPIFQAGTRSLGSAVLLALWCWARGRSLRLPAETWVAGLITGVLFAAEFLLIYIGLQYTTVARSILFLYTAPFFVALGAHFFVPGDRLSLHKVMGLVAAFGGVALVFADDSAPHGAGGDMQLAGDLMCLAAGLGWGAATVMIKATRLAAIASEKTLFYQLAVSALLLLPVSMAVGERGLFAPTLTVAASLGYQIVIVAFASYAAWFWLVNRYAASRLAVFTFLTPVFGVVAGYVILGEPVGGMLLAALALIVAGIYLVNRTPEVRIGTTGGNLARRGEGL